MIQQAKAKINSQWSSRHLRKGLVKRELKKTDDVVNLLLRSLFLPKQLNWWIGLLFAVGAGLFAYGSALSLFPVLATDLSISPARINAIFFAGSIPFTSAAFLQLWQAANVNSNSGDSASQHTRWRLFGWRPKDLGWLSCALQFVGTMLFNIDTFDAMHASSNWIEADLTVWVPNFLGSVAFLVSGYLAFIELCHHRWAWQPRSVSWWLVFANLLGCVAFMISALTAMTLPDLTNASLLAVSLVGTLTGAVFFFIGALLTLLEAGQSSALT